MEAACGPPPTDRTARIFTSPSRSAALSMLDAMLVAARDADRPHAEHLAEICPSIHQSKCLSIASRLNGPAPLAYKHSQQHDIRDLREIERVVYLVGRVDGGGRSNLAHGIGAGCNETDRSEAQRCKGRQQGNSDAEAAC